MTFRNPFRESLIAVLFLSVFAALVIIAWMSAGVVWSRVALSGGIALVLAWVGAALERRVHATQRTLNARASLARDERIRDARHALFYRTMRERAMLDASGNIISFAPGTMPIGLTRAIAEQEKFDNIVAAWARSALTREDRDMERAR